jgi:UDP-GlcNAc:undecaprenyl-phosphate GlcNAc-1-phosphate transferase
MVLSTTIGLFFLVISFVLCYLIVPRIIRVVQFKRLMDHPNKRSSHMQQVPSLGGISFYIVIMLGFYFLNFFTHADSIIPFIPGFLIIFIIGLKDDLVVISPITKLLAQVLAISFFLFEPTFQIHQLHGFMGLKEVSLFLTAPFSAFIMIAIINAYNLIDGIDGLASIVGIIIFSILGVLFYLLKFDLYFGLCLIMIGSLLAFLRYNLSTDRKIFMGDTGSLLIGFLIAVMVIRLFATPSKILQNLPFQLENLPLVVMAILVVPFFDTARVFTIRIMNKKGPFSPDRNHIHHILIDYLHLSHRRASFFIGIINILFIAVFLLLSSYITNFWLTLLMVFAILSLVYFFYKINESYSNNRRKHSIRKQLNKLKRSPNLKNDFPK